MDRFEWVPRVGRFFLTRPRDNRHGCLVLILGPDPDGAPVDLERLRAQVRGRVGVLPRRFRRRLVDNPLGWGPPILVDDPTFTVDRHVDRLPGWEDGGSDWETFDAALATFVREPMDQDLPLWRLVVAEGLPGGRSAIIVKLHHAITEGEGALASLGALLFRADPAPDGATDFGQPGPRGMDWLGLALEHALGRLGQVARITLRGLAAWRKPGRELAEWRAIRAAHRRQLTGGRSPSPLRRPVGGRNAIAVAQAPTARVQAIRAARGKVHSFDVVILAAIAGGLRQWFIERGLDPAPQVVQVPVSVNRRGLGVSRDFVEMPSFMAIPLPLEEPDAETRLRVVGERVAERAGDAPAFQSLFGMVAQLPMPLYRRLAGILYDRAPHFHLASLRGPAAKLAVGAHAVELAYIPTPVRGDLAIRFAVLTLGGQVSVTLSCDPEVVVDPAGLARHIEGALAELAGESASAERAAGTASGPSGSRLA